MIVAGLPLLDERRPIRSRQRRYTRGPSDQIKKTDLVVGTVTPGGSGPCYGLQTDDGTQYALYWATRHELTSQSLKVHIRPSRLPIDCGPGTFREITAIEP